MHLMPQLLIIFVQLFTFGTSTTNKKGQRCLSLTKSAADRISYSCNNIFSTFSQSSELKCDKMKHSD